MKTVYRRMFTRRALRRLAGSRQFGKTDYMSAASRLRSQLRPGAAVADAVVDAMARVERAEFAPQPQRELAAEDRALPIGAGQTMSQPTLVAQMLSLMRLPTDRSAEVLDVGSGSGYTSAILSQLARRVIAVERVPELAEASRTRLKRLGFDNVEVILADDDALGCVQHAPYGGILVSAAAPRVPQSLVDQLDPGATMVVPVGSRHEQRLAVVKKNADGDGLEVRYSSECRFVPLIGQDGWPDESDNDEGDTD